MKMSKFSHIFHIKDCAVFFNSLKMIPVFLSLDEEISVEKFLNSNSPLDSKIKKELLESSILIVSEEDDEISLNNLRSKILTNRPYPTIAYFILSEDCNLACKYCFLGNNKRIKSCSRSIMSKETAHKALLYFSRQIKQIPQHFDDYKEIIFYGGEPLLNFEVLKYVVNEVKKMQKINALPEQLGFSMVTNGLLLDSQKIDFIKSENINVSISIDGINEKSNSNRIDKTGQCIFGSLIKKLDLIKNRGLRIGLSVTLTEETIKDQKGLLDLLDLYQITDVCFNILMQTQDFSVQEDYYNKANDFIIDFFMKTRNTNLYEERIMRKVKSFVEQKNYLSDCAATSGSQIVIVPDGKVGICHACLENKDFFFTTIDDENPIAEYDIIRKWSMISPVNKKECLRCEALGLCGGGCPINARNLSNNNTIYSIDDAFCVHSKKILRFLIEDLYNIISNKNTNR